MNKAWKWAWHKYKAINNINKTNKAFNLYWNALPLSISFIIGAENVKYFSLFSPKHSNWPLKFFF